jgi:hypothetical protein
LGQVDNARDFLAGVLPEDVLENLDLQRLESRPTELLNDELDESRPDLVYAVPFAGKPAYLCTILEHQSTRDPTMPVRPLSAMTTLWLEHLRAERENALVPMLIGIVVQHDLAGWHTPTRFVDVYDATEKEIEPLRRFLPDFEYVLDDLTSQTEERLARRCREPYLRAALLSLRSRGIPPKPEQTGVLRQVFRALADTKNLGAIGSILSYHLAVAREGSPSMIEIIMNSHPAYEEAYVTLYDRILEKGEATMLAKLLAHKFGPLSAASRRRLAKASHEDLERWAERILTAKTLTDVFAKPK